MSSTGRDADYERKLCRQTHSLFVDSEFPALNCSLTDHEEKISGLGIVWKRPFELADKPCLYANPRQRTVNQGRLGNCWFVAACTCLTLHESVFRKVVCCPNFEDWMDYCGLLEFRFWRFGEWLTVIVDDLLPTLDGELLYCHSYRTDEFWCALLEKAYAKLLGNYEALEGGELADALMDFTGGFTECLVFSRLSELTDLNGDINSAGDTIHETVRSAGACVAPTKSQPCSVKGLLESADFVNYLYNLLLCYHLRNSLMAVAISASSPEEQETETELGLIVGHAYAVTRICAFPCRDKQKSEETASGEAQLIRLVQLINPWGQAKWRGPFADCSTDWDNLSCESSQMCLRGNKENGKFWMKFEDFLVQFNYIALCHTPIADRWFQFTPNLPECYMQMSSSDKPLVPVSSAARGLIEANASDVSDCSVNAAYQQPFLCSPRIHRPSELWTEAIFHGSWTRSSAGGCMNYTMSFDKNPQFIFDLVRRDFSALSIYLIQKTKRDPSRIISTTGLYHIGVSLFRVEANRSFPITVFDRPQLIANSLYRNSRTVWMRLNLARGRYLVLPTTYYPNCLAEFMLRFVGPPPIVAAELKPVAGILRPLSYKLDRFRILKPKHSSREISNEPSSRMDRSPHNHRCSSLLDLTPPELSTSGVVITRVTLIRAALCPVSTSFFALVTGITDPAKLSVGLSSMIPSLYIRLFCGDQIVDSSVQKAQISDILQAIGYVNFGEGFFFYFPDFDALPKVIIAKIYIQNSVFDELHSIGTFELDEHLGYGTVKNIPLLAPVATNFDQAVIRKAGSLFLRSAMRRKSRPHSSLPDPKVRLNHVKPSTHIQRMAEMKKRWIVPNSPRCCRSAFTESELLLADSDEDATDDESVYQLNSCTITGICRKPQLPQKTSVVPLR
ncbi:unnamed protein product [Calicophoron daubneyi]|uniref:Calpain catalytic domain-containing protein n=1 Tax=Calicophoron daubneyi TaxID=300641 RepID=A0AAV2T481_CALDB